VLCVHELQVAPGAQRKGVGKMLTMLTEVLAKKAGVGGVVLKIPKSNMGAAAFYTASKYAVSQLSPSKVNPWAEVGLYKLYAVDP
jgi:ribosomal protein S18 acetylase RimI-like enzyme